MFGLFKKKQTGVEDTTSTGGINLSKEEALNQLNLRKETLGISLKKQVNRDIMARVAVVMDQSGSMRHLYRDGTVQSVIERLLPLAIQFDDNGELDMWLFSNSFKRINSITEQDFFGYVDREIMNNRANQLWGGTNYAPVLRDILSKYVEQEPANIPSYVIFVTDGENFDHLEAEEVVRALSYENVFIQFIGIGNESFKFLRKLDTMDGRFIDNANFFAIEDVRQVTDEWLYDKLLAEFPQWEQLARAKGMIK